MTHTPEAIRAAELANAEGANTIRDLLPYSYGPNGIAERRAFARYIRTVSDAVEAWCDSNDSIDAVKATTVLTRFILPKPVDPLVEIFGSETMETLRNTLDAAGFEIVRKGG